MFFLVPKWNMEKVGNSDILHMKNQVKVSSGLIIIFGKISTNVILDWH